MRNLDLQGLWDTAQREVALEGSNGCTLERLWGLVGLDDTKTTGQSAGSGGVEEEEKEKESEQDTQAESRQYVKAWLWR